MDTQKKRTVGNARGSFRTPLGLATGGYVALMGLVALLMPSDMHRAYPWAVAFSDIMASWVPQIDRFEALGSQTEVNRFYYSVLWAMSPVLLVLAIFKFREDVKMGHTSRIPSQKAILPVLLVVGVIYASQHLYWFALWVDADHGLLRFMMGNRLGRAFWGNIMYVAAPVVAAGAVVALTIGWLSREIPNNLRRGRVGGDQ
jgi:hypothetical protein